MAPENIILLISGSFSLVSFASWKLNRDVQPLRVLLIDKADDLLSRAGLPDDVRRLVADNADTVFGVRSRLLFGIVVAPLVALTFVFRRRWLPDVRKQMVALPAEDRELFRDVCDLHERITFANHLILYSIFEIELLALMLVVVPLRSILRSLMRPFLHSSADLPGAGDVDLSDAAHVVRDAVEHPRYRLLRSATGMAAPC